MSHKFYKSHNAHKKSKRLKFQSLEPRMVFDGALDSLIEVGLDLGNASGVNLPDAPEAQEIIDFRTEIKEPVVSWKENPDPLVHGENESVLLLPSIRLIRGALNQQDKWFDPSAKVKRIFFGNFYKADQLKVVYNEKYKGVEGYSDLLENLQWDYRGLDFMNALLSSPKAASLEAWQAVLRSIMFTHESDHPGSSREIEINIAYDDRKYEAHVVSIAIVPTDDVMEWEAQTNRLLITNRGVAESNIFSSVFMKDPDAFLDSVVIRLNNAQSGDNLVLSEKIEGLTVLQEKNGQILRLKGFGSLAIYENALKALQFSTTSKKAAPRNIDIEFLHKGDIVDKQNVSLVLDQEGVFIENFEVMVWQSGSKNVSILPQVMLQSDKMIRSVTIKILDPILAMDRLSIKGAFRVQGIEVRINDTKNEITLTGPKTAKEYEALLRKVQYKVTQPLMSKYHSMAKIYTRNQPLSVTRVIEVTIEDEKGVKVVEKVSARVVPKVQSVEREHLRIANKTLDALHQPSMLPLSLSKNSPNIKQVIVRGFRRGDSFSRTMYPTAEAEYGKVEGFNDLYRNLLSENALEILPNNEGFILSATKAFSPEAWETYFRIVRFFRKAGNDVTSDGYTRDLFIELKDSGGHIIDTHRVLLQVTPFDAPIEWEAQMNRLNVTSSGVEESNIFNALSMEVADTWNLKSMVIRLRNPRPGDVLFLPNGVNDHGLIIIADLEDSDLKGHSVTLFSLKSVEVYEDVLQHLRFKSTSQDPTTRQIEINIVQENNSVNRNNLALSLHKEPVVGGAKITGLEPMVWQSGSKNVSILPQVTLQSDHKIRSMTIKILNPLLMDHLSIKGPFRIEGIEMTINDAKNEITLTGLKTVKEYEALLRKVQYKAKQSLMSKYTQFDPVLSKYKVTLPTAFQPLSATQTIEVTIEDEKGVKVVEKVSVRVVPKVQSAEREDFRIAHDRNRVLLHQLSMLPLSLSKDLPNIKEVVIRGLRGGDAMDVSVFVAENIKYSKVEGFNELYFALRGARSLHDSDVIIYSATNAFPPEVWETFFRCMRFLRAKGYDLTSNGDTRDISIELKDLKGHVIDTHHVLLQLKPFDAPLEWEAQTNKLNVTSSGVAESKIFNALSIEDADGWNLKSMVIRLRNACPGDALFLPKGLKDYALTISQDSHTVTLTGLASLAAYEDVLQQLRFRSTSQDSTTREIEINIVQENDSVVKKNVSLAVEPLISGIQLIFYKAGLEESVAVLPSVILNAGNLRSVTIKMVKPVAGDVLSIEDGWESEAGGIILGKKTTETEIRLRGVKAAQDYEKILRKIHYKTTQRDFLDRTIKIIIQDEHGEKKEETLSLRVEPHVEWTEKPDSHRDNDGVPLFPDLIFSEKSIASIEIDGILGEDRLQVRSSVGDVSLDGYKKGGFVGRMHQSMGLYIITGSGASPKSWERLLRSLVFNHEGDNPTGSRKISVVARDAEGFAVGKTYGVSVALKPVDDGIQWKAQTNRLTVTPDGVSAAIFESLVLEDPDTENVTLSSMVIRLKDGQSEDSLVLVDQKGLRVTLGQNNQELKLEGVRDLSVYRDVLQGLQFKSASQDLTPRKIEFELFHSNGMSTTKTLSVSLNQEASVSGIEQIESSASGSDGVSILPKVKMSSDDWISLMKITLVNPLPGDRLFMEDGWEKEANGIILGKKRTDQHIRFRGLATAQDYEKVLKKIYYKNMDSTPGMLEQRTQRQLKITTKDQHGLRKIQIFFV